MAVCAPPEAVIWNLYFIPWYDQTVIQFIVQVLKGDVNKKHESPRESWS